MGKCKNCGHQISEHFVDGEGYPKHTYHRSCLIIGCLCSKIVKIYPNKPEVNKPILLQNNKKEDGIPPTNKLVGILPKRL